jgi:hypothetical protein
VLDIAVAERGDLRADLTHPRVLRWVAMSAASKAATGRR